MNSRSSLVLVLCALPTWSCSDSADPGEKPANETLKDAATDAAPQKPLDASQVITQDKSLPCDVKTIISDHCQTCHGATPIGGAPMSLVTAEDFRAQRDGGSVLDLVKARITTTDLKKRMPPASYEALTPAELTTLQGWLNAGAQAGSDKCAVTQVDAGTQKPVEQDENLECYKMLVHSGDGVSKYGVGIAFDSYITWGFAAPWKDTAYAVVFRPIIDNKQVVHHWLLFQDDLPSLPGGPTPEVGAHPTGQLIAGWAPGGTDEDFRAGGQDVGLELPATTTYTMEMHYNSSDLFAMDQSGVEVCVSKRKPANIAGISWLGTDQLVVPSTQWTGVCRPLNTQPVHITSVWPHMHLAGKHMKAIINRANGTPETLWDADFDFNYQRTYPKDVIINPGDTITTTCTYSEPKSFGQATTAEMCYLFTTAYPKGQLAGLDVWGTFAHGGSSCLGM